MYVLLRDRQKRYSKLFTSAVFSIAPLATIHSKNEVTQKGARDGGSNKTFLEVSTKFENTKHSLFSVLLLPFVYWKTDFKLIQEQNKNVT